MAAAEEMEWWNNNAGIYYLFTHILIVVELGLQVHLFNTCAAVGNTEAGEGITLYKIFQ